jgi:murein DD-endopeptidase MepM/ murein hydrolase activator NlpD
LRFAAFGQINVNLNDFKYLLPFFGRGEISNVAQQAGAPVFGKRKEPHTIIIAQGDKIRHFTVRPWMVAAGGICVAAFAIGYLAATCYLVMRDDLIGASVTRQAQMQQGYEDRISALREQVDRITSRQLLDQQLMEGKISQLLKRQEIISRRHGRLDPVLKRAGMEPDAASGDNNPAEEGDGGQRAEIQHSDPLIGKTSLIDKIVTGSVNLRGGDQYSNLSAADRADKLFTSVTHSLKEIEHEQIASLDRLTTRTYETANAITDTLDVAGVNINAAEGMKDVGGPLVPLDASPDFDSKINELDIALDTLDAIKNEAVSFPIGNPARGHTITSRFGYRVDPFNGEKAMHTGMDFRASTGTPIKPTAAGKVTSAGWDGGYGKMVEIDHGNGYRTRYGHMSQVLVGKGDKVTADTIIGLVGSTGRSTGPHLHYEVRLDGAALNPAPFIKAGKKVRGLIAAFHGES